MNWLRGMILGGTMLGIGTTGTAQEPDRAVIRLGMPTPLADSAGVVNASAPMQAPFDPSPALQRTSYVQPMAPPTVVRGVLAAFDDEPKQPFVPGILPPLMEAKPVLPTVAPPEKKIAPVPPPSQAAQTQTKPTVINIAANGSLTVIADSAPDVLPAIPKSPTVIYDDSALMHCDASPGWLANPGPAERFYVGAEWLQWWTRGMNLPPLVTTAAPAGAPGTIGALGLPSTQLIYGNNTVLNSSQPGGRFTVGYNLDSCGFCAIEASFFFLGNNSDSAFFGSNQFPVIARPFLNINTGMQNAELTTFPGFFTGNLQVHMSSTLWGGELNSRSLLWDCCGLRVTGLIGFRYLDLHDQLGINENTTFTTAVFPASPPGAPPLFNAGDRVFAFDQFATRNQFYGGQIGANAEWQRGPWSLDAHFKLGLGVTEQSVDIEGGQQITRATGAVQNVQGGLYALSSNIGHASQSRFAVVPEVGLKIGYDLTDHIRLFVGYDFLYWSSVLRAGDQIDTSLDASKIPNVGATFPPASQVRPAVPFQTTGYWAQGFNAGILIRY